MGGLAGIVHWDGHPVEQADIKSMLSRIRHRGPDGLQHVIHSGTAFGHARLVLCTREQEHSGICWTDDHNVGIVADARIYNRKELIAALPLPRSASDAEIILHAYLRWNKNLLDRLDGDFSFAVYNRSKQELFAARDLFAAKPFFYVLFPDRLLFGSEPKQMLGFHFGVKPEPDPLEIARHLTGTLRAGKRTAWKQLCRLKPGHYLQAVPGKASQHAYWHPDLSAQPVYSNRCEYVAEIRTLLTEAVARRISVDVPVALELSGGYDSSSLNLIAGKLFMEGQQGCSQDLFSISSTYKYAETDESAYIEAVRHKLPYPGEIVEASTDSSGVDLAAALWHLDSPRAFVEEIRDQQMFSILQTRGAQVLVNGVGGDDLFWEPSCCRDLLRFGRLTDITRWAGDCHSGSSIFTWLVDSFRQSAPSWLRMVYRSLKHKNHLELERSILSPDLLHELFLDDQVDASYPLPESLTCCQAEIFGWLTNSRMLRTLEDMEIRSAWQGIERRQPFYDRKLVELILSIPWFIHVRHQGQMKSLLRDSVADLLPESVRVRNNKATFDPFFIAVLEKHLPYLRKMLHLNNDINSYIDKGHALALFGQDNFQEIHLWSQVQQIWAVATLQMWLHNCSQYHIDSGE